jgi:deoxycytidine triphosphate deaminase
MGETAIPEHPGAGVLVKRDIRRLKLIEIPDGEEHADDRCYKPASYDLRLGHEYIIPGQQEVGLQQAKILDCRQTENKVVIKPFSSVVVCTYEILSLPPNVVGKFNLRIKQAFRGLIVQMGTQVEPRYRGRLFALLQNITDQPVAILYKDYKTRPFTIEFQYTTAASESDGDRKQILALKDFVEDVQVSSTLDLILEKAHAAEAASLKLLDDRITEAEKNQLGLKSQLESEIRAAGPRWLAIFGTIFGVVLSFAVAAIITVAAPMMLKYVFDYWPHGGLRAVAISEAAKTLSESVRDENERLKKRIEEMQTKATATDESLDKSTKRLSDLEQKVASSTKPVVVAPPANRKKLRRRRGRR